VSQRLAPLDAVELLGRNRPPEVVEHGGRIAADFLFWALEMLAPQP